MDDDKNKDNTIYNPTYVSTVKVKMEEYTQRPINELLLGNFKTLPDSTPPDYYWQLTKIC